MNPSHRVIKSMVMSSCRRVRACVREHYRVGRKREKEEERGMQEECKIIYCALEQATAYEWEHNAMNGSTGNGGRSCRHH